MRKVVLTDENEDESKTCYISETETPRKILEHFNISPDTKIVYVNGVIISNEKMKEPIRARAPIFMSIHNKTVMRT